MADSELLTRLNSGKSTSPMEGQGSKYAPRLTDTEIKVAAGMVEDSFDYALLLALHQCGLDGYHHQDKFGYGVTFQSLKRGVRDIAWEIRQHRKRADLDRVLSNLIAAPFALDAFFRRPHSQEKLADAFGVTRPTWRSRFAEHYSDVVTELDIRAANAMEDVRRKL